MLTELVFADFIFIPPFVLGDRPGQGGFAPQQAGSAPAGISAAERTLKTTCVLQVDVAVAVEIKAHAVWFQQTSVRAGHARPEGYVVVQIDAPVDVDTRSRVKALYQQNPKMTAREAAEILDINHTTVSRHVRSLKGTGELS